MCQFNITYNIIDVITLENVEMGPVFNILEMLLCSFSENFQHVDTNGCWANINT